MSSLTDAVKYLNVTPARVATATDLESSQSLIKPLKYISLVPSRTLQKVTTSLNFTPFSFNQFQLPGIVFPALIFQYNITLPSNSYLLNAQALRVAQIQFVNNNLGIVRNGCMMIKWRHGNNVTRRFIFGSKSADPVHEDTNLIVIFDPDYNNDLIPQNFVIEYWMTININFSQPALQFGINNPFSLIFSILNFPADADNTFLNTTIVNPPKQFSDFGYNLPVNLPINQPIVVWNDN